MNAQQNVPKLIALKQIIETTSAYTGKEFFKALVKHLAEILNVHGVWITEYLPKQNKLNALAFYLDGKQVEEYSYLVTNTPCEPVLNSHDLCHIPKNVIELYPKDPDLRPVGAVSYMGISLRDVDDRVLGHLAMLDDKPMPEIPEVFAIFKIFASRAAAELRREIAQAKISESASKLNRLVNGTSDAILEFDSNLKITQANAAASKMLKYPKQDFIRMDLKGIFNMSSMANLKALIPKHKALSNEHGSLQLNDALTCIDQKNESFPVSANLSCYLFEDEMYHVLYLKNIKDQLSDKYTIKALSLETTMLKEKMESHQFSYIIGESKCIKDALELVHQVGPTDANVLIQGETGTGKELFAKAVHDASSRKDKTLITLNCAALPSELIESELFGHVKGAYTGALTAREGRFSLADQGTIFLDEIAELPLPLQAKLLRVIQEGSFEPLGSSETIHVDVRIIAATHRDLGQWVDQGRFREDLYYRLNVFPIHIPPLRERGGDIKLLANAFYEKFSNNRAIHLSPFSKSDLMNLQMHHWPGNVRELQNVVERSIITNIDGKPHLEITTRQGGLKKKESRPDQNAVLTFDQMKNLEKENIVKALNLTQWKISGKNGAA
jgi:transcriptional regulator with PAS, ATPase and Fis domain